jgi:GLPGLI family protein
MKLIISIISFVLVTASVFSQETLDTSYLECRYKFTLMSDTTENKTGVKDIDMRLLLGKKYSKFYSYTTFFSDSIINSVPSERLMANNGANMIELLTKNPQGERYVIYKCYEKNTITFTDRLPSKVLYKEPVSKQNWKILLEKKDINGYKCQKATCTFRGRDYVAWFTHEIPINEGPWKFNGLPGLIIKVYDTKNHYDFELYSVNKDKKEIVFSEKNYEEVNIKNYILMSKNRIKNPFVGQDVTFKKDGLPIIPDPKRYDVMERDIK